MLSKDASWASPPSDDKYVEMLDLMTPNADTMWSGSMTEAWQAVFQPGVPKTICMIADGANE